MQELVKSHIPDCPSKCQKRWMHKTHDELCEEYPKFLAAVAKTGLRVSTKALTLALKHEFEGKPSTLEAFSKQMVLASGWARRKVRQVSDGSKTEPGLLAIVKAWREWIAKTKNEDESSQMEGRADLLEQSDSSEVEVLEDNIAEDHPSEEADLAKAIHMRALSSFAKEAATKRKLTPCLTLSSDDGSPAKKAKAMHIVTHACARMRSVL
jgi:hypothetical protein